MEKETFIKAASSLVFTKTPYEMYEMLLVYTFHTPNSYYLPNDIAISQDFEDWNPLVLLRFIRNTAIEMENMYQLGLNKR